MTVKVLIVDDDEASAKTLMWAMELKGFEARMTLDAITALDMVNTFIPQVFLVDINMSYLNGYELCKTLRADPLLKDALFIAQTGWNGESHKAQSKDVGFHHHLVKPIDMDELVTIIRKEFPPAQVAEAQK